MARMSRKERQSILDNYMSESRANTFHAREFLEWLSERPEHECYDLFFGVDEATAAQRHREDLVRNWVSDLRIRATVSVMPRSSRSVKVQVQEYEFPAMYSPMKGRTSGGGYLSTDPSNGDCIDSLRDEARSALASWLARYEGVMAASHADVKPVRKLLEQLESKAQAIAAE